MNNFDKDIKSIFNKQIKEPYGYKCMINETLNELPEKRNKGILFNIKMIASIVACFFFASGIVFAKDIGQNIYNFYETGKGTNTAINNGYILENDSNYFESQNKSDNSENALSGENVKVKIDDLVMDDYSISTTINVNLPDEILDVVNKDDIWNLNFKDLLIYDENENVIFANDLNVAQEYLRVENLNEVLDSEKFFNLGSNTFLKERKINPVKAIINLTNEDMENPLPHSKKLYFAFKHIEIENDEDSTKSEKYMITGDWTVEVNLPKVMYEREKNAYKVVGINNKNYTDKIISFNVTNTMTTVKLHVDSQRIKSESPESKFWSIVDIDKCCDFNQNEKNAIQNYITKKLYKMSEIQEWEENYRKQFVLEDVYIEDKSNNKFDLYQGPMANGASNFIDDNTLEVTEIFNYTTYDMEDEITLHFKYMGREVIFDLVKEDENEK